MSIRYLIFIVYFCRMHSVSLSSPLCLRSVREYFETTFCGRDYSDSEVPTSSYVLGIITGYRLVRTDYESTQVCLDLSQGSNEEFRLQFTGKFNFGFNFELSLRDIWNFCHSENADHPHSLNFEDVDAVGHVACIRGVTIESYDFNYDSNIHVFNGEFRYSMDKSHSLREFWNLTRIYEAVYVVFRRILSVFSTFDLYLIHTLFHFRKVFASF